MVRVNKFLKTVDAYKYHTRLSGFLRIVLREYGIKEFLRYLKYAHDNKVSITAKNRVQKMHLLIS